MRWLRSKPLDINEIDESRIWHARYGGDPDGDEAVVADEVDGEDAVMAGQRPHMPSTGVSVAGPSQGQGQDAAATTVAGRRKAPMRKSKGRGRAGEGVEGGGGGG